MSREKIKENEDITSKRNEKRETINHELLTYCLFRCTKLHNRHEDEDENKKNNEKKHEEWADRRRETLSRRINFKLP